MEVLLGLVTAAAFGTGDFFGGLSAKRTAVLYVVGFSHLFGLIGMAVLAPIVADMFTWQDFGLGVIAGAVGGVGVALLYRGLARGPMAVVAPLTAITSAAVPAAWGVLDGETFSAWAWIGIGFALVAIALTSIPSAGDMTPVTNRVIVESLLAGVGFGTMFIFYDITNDAAAPWPLVGARLITAGVLVTVIMTARRSGLPSARRAMWPIVLTGLFDTGSNAAFLYATTLGDLTIVAVLSSLYPATTVLLARFVLDERVSRTQLTGLFAALLATALIALG